MVGNPVISIYPVRSINYTEPWITAGWGSVMWWCHVCALVDTLLTASALAALRIRITD